MYTRSLLLRKGRMFAQQLGKQCFSQSRPCISHLASLPLSSLPLSSSSSFSGEALWPHFMSFHTTSMALDKKKKDNDDYDADDVDDEQQNPRDVLLDLLGREYAEEKQNKTTTMPEDLAQVKKDLEAKGWKIVDQGGMTRMVRVLDNNVKVHVGFHCQDLVTSDEDNKYADKEEDEEKDSKEREDYEEEEEEEEEDSVPVKFTAVVSKAGHSMVLGMLSQYSCCVVQGVSLTSQASTDDVTSLLNEGAVPSSEYQGPEFTELAEDLQYALQDWVEMELQLDEDVASFVAMYADYKEQTHYVDFLKRAKDFLS